MTDTERYGEHRGKLEFHHKYGRSWRATEVNGRTRLKLYRRDWGKGLVELLCQEHHRQAAERGEGGEFVKPGTGREAGED